MNSNEVKVTFEDSTDSKATLFVTIDEESREMTMKAKFEPEIDWKDLDSASYAHKFAVWMLNKFEKKS